VAEVPTAQAYRERWRITVVLTVGTVGWFSGICVDVPAASRAAWRSEPLFHRFWAMLVSSRLANLKDQRRSVSPVSGNLVSVSLWLVLIPERLGDLRTRGS